MHKKTVAFEPSDLTLKVEFIIINN